MGPRFVLNEDFLSPFRLMRKFATGENDIGARLNENSEPRLTMRALGRSASSKIKRGWEDWK